MNRIPVTRLRGVGPRNAERLARLGIDSVEDVLLHLPLRYQDRTRVRPIGILQPGEQAVVQGTVESCTVKLGRRRSLLVRIADESGVLVLRFFHFSAAQKAGLGQGECLVCYGEVRRGPSSLEMIHPEYQRIEAGESPRVEEGLTPVYPTTEGMHQTTWRSLTEKALALHSDTSLAELLPEAIRRRFGFPELAEAIRYIHRPPKDASLSDLLSGRHPAQRRLAFEELLAHRLSLRLIREDLKELPAPPLVSDGHLRKRVLGALPFDLTRAQRRVIEEIRKDLLQDHPMLRLLQGDVGSGKTVVAALAAVQAIEAGHQVAIMAPTELLAEQHLRSFRNWLEPLNLEPVWLRSRNQGRGRKAVLDAVAQGQAQLVVGTHALFQKEVAFDSLGLVIIDEQHRFGVHQRMALRDKGAGPGHAVHQLIMTATPIPRTLAMTAYADLDLSIIDELPKGRVPVRTVVMPDDRRDEVTERVRLACLSGRQAYWVCTLIEESEALQCRAAEETAARLAAALPELRIDMVHGRIDAEAKERAMSLFQSGALDVLVATTVIEVGVDVTNASLIIIENPERLGLAQLHQLRGRVGRGQVESHCVLMYHPPLSDSAQERLAVMRNSTDGFVIAQKDLELRGPGEVLGARQTGEIQFRIADLLRDQDLVPNVQQAAELMHRNHSPQARKLVRRWLGARDGYIHA